MTVSQNNPSSSGDIKKQPYHFGEKLRAVRERKGYTLKVVAQKAGVSESLVSQIERTELVLPLIRFLCWPMCWTLIWNFFLEYHTNRF